MPRQKHQKIKIIKILDYLRAARGQEAALTTNQLCFMLQNEGIPCDRRTLSDDIETLTKYIEKNPDYDFTIQYFHTYRGHAYYSADKENIEKFFSYDELKNLINAVNSLHLTDDITKETTEQLKQKLIGAAPVKYRSKLRQYADDDNTYALDTVAAKILIDSINSLTFMKDNMSSHIIDTIIKMSDSVDRRVLADEKNNPIYHKHSDEGITIYEIDTLLRAIDSQIKISFKYFDLDENREKVYRHGGKEYIAEPLTLIQNDNHYYLICYDKETDSHIKTYRLDRITNVTEKARSKGISEEAKEFKKTLPTLTNQIFRMYSGERKTVTLEFSDKLIGTVFDTFGPNIKITRKDNETCLITEDIQISPPFWGWLFQFSDEMKIVAPSEVAEEYKNRCLSIYSH